MADLASNRKAFHNYQILDKLEAGIALVGTEVKSCRAHNVNLSDAYARIQNNEVLLFNLHISPYEQGHSQNHEPRRIRKLLLHRAEIRKLTIATREKGLALIPLALYLKKNRVKVSLGICRGKTMGDKRETLRKQQAEMDMRRALHRR